MHKVVCLAKIISIKVYTVSSIRDHIIPKSLKCSNSATKYGAEAISRFRTSGLWLRAQGI